MSHPFEAQLAHIRETLLLMSTLTDRSLSLAVRAVVERDNSLADLVEASDGEIDQLEVAVDDLVVTYMATHGPIARDSRMMLIASKISSSLERIADQATTIARRARALNQEPPLIAVEDIPAMATLTQEMLQEAITSFVEGRYELAQAVIPRDKEVDELNRRIAKKLINLMIESPDNVNRAVHLMTIAKAIERAADHVQNIAEEVFYLFSGQDIRHEPGA
ncbi:MAG: phosphate signaling complex protein PhoU [Chthoniobacteraceae bacterium]|nr:phosphate signaling complex protein PhoU [Chthoniobacteraceae bacterium]